jgi:signal transduction histidine kinase
MPSNTHLARRAVLGVVAHVLGGLTMLLEMVFIVVLTPVHAIPIARPGIDALGRTLVSLNRRRLVRYLDFDDHLCVMPDWRRAYSYLVRRLVVGCISTTIMMLAVLGGGSYAVVIWQVMRGEPIGGSSGDVSGNGNAWFEYVGVGALGFVLVFVAVWGLIGVVMLERKLANHYLGPSEAELLRRRVTELANTRAGVVEAVNDERRRIERDLHDGVQQRLVALGLLLGRALRAKEPGHATRLLEQAHEESQQALNDLREVTWRVYPSALDKDGLRVALQGVADRASVPVRVRYALTARPDLATETVVYFVASEAVTNALKHGDPTGITIVVAREEDEVVVTVRDNGRGGADVTGTGLSGLARRVAAADGVFQVISPVGGPTEVEARLPVPPEPSEPPMAVERVERRLTPATGRR